MGERGTVVPALISKATPGRSPTARRSDRLARRNAAAALLWMLLASTLVMTGRVSAAEPFGRGLLWRLDRPGIATSWVFGTLHSNDPRVTVLPAPVAQAFARARTLAMERFWSEAGDAQFYEAMQFDDGRLLAPLLGDDAYVKLKEELDGAAPPEEALAHTKPWAALLRVAAARSTGEGPTLDRGLLIAARERRMTILGLELLDEQIAALDSIPVDTQIALLRHALEHRALLDAQIEPAILAWLHRDLAALANLDRATAGDDRDLKRHYEVLTQQVVSNRSALMAHRLFLPLKRGRVFVAVGALHLYGRRGLLAQLHEQGYRVRRLY